MNDLLEISNPTQAEYFKDIVGTIREPLVVLDADLRVLAANRSFYKFFKVKAGETIGQLVYDLGNRQWDIPGLRLLLETILPKKTAFNDYNVEHDFPTIGRRILLLNARRISRTPHKAPWILLVFEDVTERIEMERKLQASEERFRRAFETAQDGMLLIGKTGGQVVNSNESAQDSLGYSKQSLQKKNLWEIGILKDEQQFRQTALELEEQGSVGLPDMTIPTKRGGHFPADVLLTDRATVIQCNIRDISDRKRAEEALQALKGKYRAIFENAMEGIFQSTPEGRFLTLNPAFARMLGYESPEEMIATITDIGRQVYVESPRRAEFMQLMAEQGSVSGFEFQMHRKDGGTIWVSENARAIRDANDTLLYYEGTTEDITERKWTEEALRESEHRVSEALEFNRKILNTSSIGILTYNESGQCVSANTAAAKITGGTLPQLLAQNFHEIPSWKKSGMYQAAIRALDTGIEQLLEVHFVTTFGKDGWLSFSFTPFDSAGERHLLVFVSDITEGKQAEQALVESVNKFRWLYEYAPVAYHILTPEGTLTDVNHRWCELLGYPREEVLGKAIFDFVVEQEREAAKDSFEKKKQSKQSFVDGSERNFRTKDGAVRTFKIYDFFSLDERQHIISVQTTIEDITERKQAEEKIKEYSEHLEEMVAERTRELRDAQEELVRKEKLAVLGTLAGGVGHKLRNPLGVISNSVYYLKMVQPDADEKIKKHHAMIDQEVHNAAHIVSDLLDYARVISTDRKTVPVSKLVEHTLSHFPVPASIMVSLKIAVDLPTIYVDPLHVEQVLGNLVTNACQAMSDGGKLIISAREVVPVYARGQKKKMVAIAVKDTGTGITPENKEKLFEALFSTKAKGIGLGLAVSKKLAEANGGRIEVESQVGKGSTFTLYLPVISSDKDS